MNGLESICVYCGSSNAGPPPHREMAAQLGRMMVERGIALVYGGGQVGVMGAIADAVMAAGGRVTGVIPDFLMRDEVGHTELTALEVVETMHERKARMAELADAFVILPGGLGTLEELFEIVTWRQLGLHDKPIVAVDPDGYWDPLRVLLDRAVETKYARPENTGLLMFSEDPGKALDWLTARAGRETHLDSDRL